MNVTGLGKSCREIALSTPRWVALTAGITGLALLAIGLLPNSAGLPLPNAFLPLALGFKLVLIAGWVLAEQNRPRKGFVVAWANKRAPQMPHSGNSPPKMTHSQLEMLQKAKPYLHTKVVAEKKEIDLLLQKKINLQTPALTFVYDEYLLGFLQAKVRHALGDRLAYVSDRGAVCLSEGNEILCNLGKITAICRFRDELFLGSSTGSVQQLNTEGTYQRDWQLETPVPIDVIAVDDQYIVAITSQSKHLTILERDTRKTLGTITYHGELDSNACYLYDGVLFFHFEGALECLELSSRIGTTIRIPEECKNATFLGVWGDVAFLATKPWRLNLLHYPAQTILNRVECNSHSFQLGACVESNSKLTFLGFAACQVGTLEWIFNEQEAPAPKLTGSFVPQTKGVIAEEASSAFELLALPKDLLPPILHSLDPHAFANARLTCKALWELSKHDIFWSGRLGLHTSTYFLYSGTSFKEEFRTRKGEYQCLHSTVYTSPFSSHVARLRTFPKATNLFIDQEINTSFTHSNPPDIIGIHGDLLSLYEGLTLTHFYLFKLIDLTSGTVLTQKLIKHPYPGWQDEQFAYLGTSEGKVLRYSRNGTNKALSITDKACKRLYVDSTHLIFGTANEVIWMQHCDLEPIETTKGTLGWEQPPLWYAFNREALFYQYKASPLYAFFFASSVKRKIKTCGPVDFLDTQGSVLMMRENWNLVLLNYRTGERLNTIPMDPDTNAKFYGQDILVESAGKSLTLSWDPKG